ncbi:MAG: hypothetical protein CL912_30810 [Deltaproteobacteria bacterium]|nr:hypothetical protein [Deltaproteobacteria bacterium]
MVKILTFDSNQWVAYDDTDTLKMKADFARSQCMGGIMVWAVSHDTSKGDFSKGLATAANRKVIALKATDGTNDTTVTSYAQCKWTNCAESRYCIFSKSTQC